jgi:predicted ATPase
VVDTDTFELRRSGEAVEVQPRVLSLLIFLLENRDRAVTKEEILDAVWPDTATSEGSLTRAVSFARAALGEGQSDAEIIRTVRGRGYSIGVPVELEDGPRQPKSSDDPKSNFLCRDKELALARSALLQAIGGSGQVLLVVGEPGIGKTRLAEEVSSIATERGALACWGRCPEEEGAPSYWPWVQVLRAFVAARGAESVRAHLGERAIELRELLPEIRYELEDLGPPEHESATQARFRLFDAVTSLLLAAATRQPLVVLLDDLQSADPASLALLRFLAPSLRGARILVVATYRDAEVVPGDPLEATLAELVRSQRPQRTIFLRGLTQSCVRHFTHKFTEIEPTDELVEALYERTEGNPLFLIELLEWLSTRDGEEDARTPLDVRRARVPEGVRHVIGRRLDALSDECQHVVQIAAVIGLEFSMPVLAPACELPEDAVLEHLETAERRRVVEPVRGGRGRFWFTHALIAETLRAQLGSASRARAHQRIGKILEKLYASPRGDGTENGEIPGPQLAELAHHFGEAAVVGELDKALDYASRAADYALSVLAFEEAVEAYERVLSLVDSGAALAPAARSRVLISLAEAQQGSGDRKAARRSIEQVMERARVTEDSALFAAAKELAGRIEEAG